MLTDEQFRTGIAVGDELAYSRWGAANGGLSAEQVKDLFKSESKQQLFNNQRQQNKVDFAAAKNQLFADQQVAVLQQFESMHPGAAAAFADYIRTPRFQSRMGMEADRAGLGDLPTQLAAAAGGNTLRDRLSSAMNGYTQAATRAQRQAAIDHAATIQSYGNDPFVRGSAVLAANPNLTPAEEKVLMDTVRKLVVGTGPTRGGTYGTELTFTAINDVIMNNKFQDPKLERLRKTAAATWKQDLEAADRVARGIRGY
jgi:hypothetical protein